MPEQTSEPAEDPGPDRVRTVRLERGITMDRVPRLGEPHVNYPNTPQHANHTQWGSYRKPLQIEVYN
jgi:hypothetical protein